MEARNNEEEENEGAGKVASEWGAFAPRSPRPPSSFAVAPRLLDPSDIHTQVSVNADQSCGIRSLG
jgi:hypothetical protein